MFRLTNLVLLILLFPVIVFATVPKQINHQGVVRVDGTAFEGTGLFRFAIVDPDAPVNLWSNDGSITGAVGGIPTAAVSLNVIRGVYSVRLGNPDPPFNMVVIPSSVFNDDNTVLRIWFDDGVNGLQQLTPDHKLTTMPYVFTAATSAALINGIPDDPIISIPDGGPGQAVVNDPFYVSNNTTLAGKTTILTPTLGGTQLRIQDEGGDNPNIQFFDRFGNRIGLIDAVGSEGVFRLTAQTGLAVALFAGGNLGVYVAPGGSVGIGTTSIAPDRFRVIGGSRVDGNFCVTGVIGACSDKRFKKNLIGIKNALSKVLSLRGINFDWKRNEYPDWKFNEGRQVGFVAQEMKDVLPEAVNQRPDGFYSVDYGRVTPVLVEAVKELHGLAKARDTQLASQRQQIASLKTRLGRLETLMHTVVNAQPLDSNPNGKEIAHVVVGK